MKRHEEKAILLMGNTGVGKSTLAHWLAGAKLKSVENEEGVFVVDGFDINLKEVGHSMASTTTIPNKFVVNDELVIWDCPGFGSTFGLQQQVSDSFYIKQLFSKHEKMKFVFVATWQSMSDCRGTPFIPILKDFCNSFMDVELVKDSVSLVITQGARDVKKEFLKKFEDVGFLSSKLLPAEKHLAPNMAKMIGYLSKNMMFFHQPTSIEVPECELLQKIDGVGYYADTTKELGKYNLSQETIDAFLKVYGEEDLKMLEPLIPVNSLLNLVLDHNLLGEEFVELNIDYIKEKITKKICNAANIQEVMQWTANLEKNAELLKNAGFVALDDLAKKLCVFGGNIKVTPVWLKTLNKIASESDGLVTKEQFEKFQCLLGTKLKFVAVKKIFDTIKILPTEDHTINQSDIPEVKLVAENHEDN
jgi:energy-coupling factor transporter ATP-binding protein EcfA2